MLWLYLAFLVALGTSCQDVISKFLVKKLDTYVVMWGWWFFALPFFCLCFLVQPFIIKNSQFWVILAIDSVLLPLGVMFYIRALRASDLSLTVPMLSFTPMFMLVTSRIMLNEAPRPLGLLGILAIVVGSYMLNIKDRSLGWWQPFASLWRERGPRYMLLVAVIFSIGGNLDKMAVQRSSALTWLVMLTAASSVWMGLVMLFKVKDVGQQIRAHWPKLLCLGAVNAVTYIIQLIAIMMTIVPYLIAIKRMSVIMTSMYGFIFLKEKGFRERFIGIALMVAGVFLISFAG